MVAFGEAHPYSLYDEENSRIDSFESVKAAHRQVGRLLSEAKEEIEMHTEELVAALDETRAYEEFLNEVGNQPVERCAACGWPTPERKAGTDEASN